VERQWTVLVWIAGDNNLSDAGVDDIRELKTVGSTDAVDVVVQYDRQGADGTRRYHLHKDTSLDDDLVQELGATDTGDPAVAIDFFTWGIGKWPSEKVLAVLWNHGSGIDETDIYNRAEAVAPRADAPEAVVVRGRARAVAASPLKRALFSTTVDQALTVRGIGYDDSARDFLDNAELKRVLDEVQADTGHPVDVLGFDACLMNMVEVAYQLRGTAANIVGSEETEPGAGWPYGDVMAVLQASPEIAPRDLAERIVASYLASYEDDPSEGVTQSAMAVERVDGVAKAIDALAEACIPALDNFEEYYAFDKAAKNAQRFYTKDFVDLGDFCAELEARSATDAVKAAARGVADALGGASPFVLAAGHHGPGVEKATGTSIYLPIRGDVHVAYDQLDFAHDTRWDDLLKRYQQA
jgi:Clostripain family